MTSRPRPDSRIHLGGFLINAGPLTVPARSSRSNQRRTANFWGQCVNSYAATGDRSRIGLNAICACQFGIPFANFAAMRKQNQNGNSVPVRRGALLLSDTAWSEIARTLGLTQRELQIVHSVFDNLPEAGIAQRLNISEHTVHTHLNRLFKKLSVTTRADLVLRIMEQLISLTLAETGVLPPICRRHHTGSCDLHTAPAAQVPTP